MPVAITKKSARPFFFLKKGEIEKETKWEKKNDGNVFKTRKRPF